MSERDPQHALLDVEAQFYLAFERGDATLMATLWHPTHPISCIHPGGTRLTGAEAIEGSWRVILPEMKGVVARFDEVVQWPQKLPSAFSAASESFDGLLVARAGRERFYVGGELRGVLLATNLYQWCAADTRWYLVEHHASPDARPTDAPIGSSRLQ